LKLETRNPKLETAEGPKPETRNSKLPKARNPKLETAEGLPSLRGNYSL